MDIEKIKKKFELLYNDQKEKGDGDFSYKSLAMMYKFLKHSKIIPTPFITVDEDGHFHCLWKINDNEEIIIMFFPDGTANFLYTLEAPNRYVKSVDGHINDIIKYEIQDNIIQKLLIGDKNG